MNSLPLKAISYICKRGWDEKSAFHFGRAQQIYEAKSSYKLKAIRGFTLLETLLALGVIAIIAAVSFVSLSRVNTDKALSVEADKAISLLTRARSLTLSAKDNSVYGVHVEERKFVLFTGATYSPNASTNEAAALSDEVKVVSTALSGGGSDIVFKRLTGATLQSGTITLAAVRDSGKTKVITIEATGIAYSN